MLSGRAVIWYDGNRDDSFYAKRFWLWYIICAYRLLGWRHWKHHERILQTLNQWLHLYFLSHLIPLFLSLDQPHNVQNTWAAAKQFGVPKFTGDAMDVITNPDVDAVWICSPSQYHAEQIKACAANGKHVFCEKPLATDLADNILPFSALETVGLETMTGTTPGALVMALRWTIPILPHPITPTFTSLESISSTDMAKDAARVECIIFGAFNVNASTLSPVRAATKSEVTVANFIDNLI